MKLIPVPISLREAREFVGNFHRHNKPPQGGKFAIGASYDDCLVGVAIVGNPVARRMMDGWIYSGSNKGMCAERCTKEYLFLSIRKVLADLATDGR